MIVENLLKIVWFLLNFILNLLPDIPQMPDIITLSVSKVLDIIFSNVGLLGVFVPLDLVKVIVPLFLIVYNFEKIYSVLMWIVRKIPFLNIN